MKNGKNRKIDAGERTRIRVITAIATILLLVLSSVLITPVIADEGGEDEVVLTYTPTDDAQVICRKPTTNYGSLPTLKIRNEYGAQSSAWDLDSLIKFDLSEISSELADNIISAELGLFYYNHDDNNPSGREIQLFRLKENWDEMTATYSNQPDSEESASSKSNVPSSYGEWMIFDVKEDIEKFVSGEISNFGWKLSDENYWGNVNIPVSYFYSKERSENKPYLKITFADDTAPETSCDLTGDMGKNDFYVSEVLVELKAEDDLSGVVLLAFSIDNGPYHYYYGTDSYSTVIEEDGGHIVKFYAIDNALNIEEEKTVVFNIDKTAPETVCMFEGLGPTPGQYMNHVTVTLRAGDAISGVDQTFYKLDNEEEFRVYEAPIVVTGEGHHVIHFFSTDLAGNEEEVNVEEFMVLSSMEEAPRSISLDMQR